MIIKVLEHDPISNDGELLDLSDHVRVAREKIHLEKRPDFSLRFVIRQVRPSGLMDHARRLPKVARVGARRHPDACKTGMIKFGYIFGPVYKKLAQNWIQRHITQSD